MLASWFCVLGLMLTAYVVLDGFDFGAGIVHLAVAKTDDERRTVFTAIGPLWDGNEVWLLASGGAFVFAFPRAYAAAFSGLYLAFMVVLWLLVLRGLSIEVRSLVPNQLWRAGWDAVFAGASTIMAFVLGVALGNLVRGVPLDVSGYFHEDLFAAIGTESVGAIDAFTALYGLFACIVLGAHGATFLAWKTSDELGARSRRAAQMLWKIAGGVGVVTTVATGWDQPAFLTRVVARPWLWPLPLVAVVSVLITLRSIAKRRELRAFLASCTFIASMLVATGGALYPVLLRSTLDDAFTLDVYNAASSQAGLAVGLALWAPAMVLAVGYFAYLFRSFRGKASHAESH